jgi:adenylate cyclase
MSETRKLAAILVADVVSYSRLAGTDEERILARLRALRSDLIDPTIALHRGLIVKRTGDGSIIEFRSIVDAVRCAIEVQSGMLERNAGLPPEKRIEFRIGIHLGDVVEESDGDLMGDGVNIAARLQSVAKPGAICLSEDAYRQVRQRLDLKFSDLGATQLKNIAEPIHVYSLEVGQAALAKRKAHEPKPRLAFAPVAAAITALLLLAAAGGWYIVNGRTPKPAEAAHLSLVVLPFANLSGDPAQDYLVDALTDELTTSLARIPGSFVIARNTAYTYKGKPVDAKAIGKDLGVRYVLEGSVQPSGDHVRVNAQLIDAESGAHLWADQFDAARADLLQMQDEIVGHLARGMEIQLPEAEAARAKRASAANPDAEDLALQCEAGVQKRGDSGENADAAVRHCEQALAADPDNVRALTWLSANIYYQVTAGRSVDQTADLKRADELASKALALDSNYARAHSVKGSILMIHGYLDESIAEYERALTLDPALMGAVGGLGWAYLRLGQFEKSVEYFDKAIRLSPRDPYLGSWYNGKSAGQINSKQYDQAIEGARRGIVITPTNSWTHFNLVAALALAGHEAEAHDALQNYLASVPSGPKTMAAVTAAFAQCCGAFRAPRYLEAIDRYYDGLRKAGMPEGDKKMD